MVAVRPPVPNKPPALRSKQNSIEDVSKHDTTPPPLPARRITNTTSISMEENLSESQGSESTSISLTHIPLTNPPIKAFGMKWVSRTGPHFDNRLNIPRSSKTINDITAGGTIILTTTSSTISCWDVLSGESNWTISSGFDVPTSITLVSESKFVVGTQGGNIMLGDADKAVLFKSMSISGRCIKHLFVANEELWAIDELGWVHLWRIVEREINADTKSGVARIIQQATYVHVTTSGIVWAAVGKVMEVHRRSTACGLELLARFDFELDMGLGNVTNVTAMTSNDDGSILVSGHEDGNLVMWGSPECLPIAIYRTGQHKITSIISTKGNFLWVGYSNGRIQIIDISKAWELMCDFKPHQNPIVGLCCAQFGITPLCCLVVSFCSAGGINCWDALLRDRTIRDSLFNRYEEYSTMYPLQVRICSWNVDSNRPPSDQSFWQDWLGINGHPDLIITGIQEMIDLESTSANARLFINSKGNANAAIADDNPSLAQSWIDKILEFIPDYNLVIQRNMVGLLLAVFAKPTIPHKLHHLAVDVVKNGLNGLHGNKGAIAIRLLIDDSSYCIVNCHLAAGHAQVSARNADAANILKTATYTRLAQSESVFLGGEGQSICDNEHVILFGDLNYRINLNRSAVEELMELGNYADLVRHDQLIQQTTALNHPLSAFQEGQIAFLPTYKYDRGSDTLDSSEKRRVPAYCDRILLRSTWTGAKIEDYRSLSSMRISDHRPVAANLGLITKKIDPIKRELVRLQVLQEWLSKFVTV